MPNSIEPMLQPDQAALRRRPKNPRPATDAIKSGSAAGSGTGARVKLELAEADDDKLV